MRKIKTPDALTNFDDWGRYLRKRILKARKREQQVSSVPLIQTEWGASRYYLYEYYRSLDQANLVDSLIEKLGPRRGPRGERAGHLLRLVEKPKPFLHVSKKSRLARDLEFALSYDINPKLVLGFLCEVGSQKAIQDSFHHDIHHEAAERYCI